MNNKDVLYIGLDVHEVESQAAVFEKEGSLLMEERLPTKHLEAFLSSLPGKKHVAMESVGFVYPVLERLSAVQDCDVSVANPNKLHLISESATKNDRNDARVLGNLLRTNYLPIAHMRDETTRERLYVIKDRVRYGAMSGELRGSIRWWTGPPILGTLFDAQAVRPYSWWSAP